MFAWYGYNDYIYAMILINLTTDEVIECHDAEAARILGVAKKTIWDWKVNKGTKKRMFDSGRNGVFEVRFQDVKRIKKKVGFALRRNDSNNFKTK
jgi:hypothetical protein